MIAYAYSFENFGAVDGFPTFYTNDGSDRRETFKINFLVPRRIAAVLKYLLQLTWCEVFLQEVLDSADYFWKYRPSNFGQEFGQFKGIFWSISATPKLGDTDQGSSV